MASGTQNGRGNKLTNKYLFISGFTLNRGQVVSVTMTEKGKQSGFFFLFSAFAISTVGWLRVSRQKS